MAVCWCSLAGTAACQHCAQNPFATDVWTNKTVTVDHIDATPFSNGLDVCPVCGKPSTIGKPQTNYDRLISKTPEELAKWIVEIVDCNECEEMHGFRMCDAVPGKACEDYWAGWLNAPVEVDDGT